MQFGQKSKISIGREQCILGGSLRDKGGFLLLSEYPTASQGKDVMAWRMLMGRMNLRKWSVAIYNWIVLDWLPLLSCVSLMLSPNSPVYCTHQSILHCCRFFLRILLFRAESDCVAKDRPGLPEMGALALDSTWMPTGKWSSPSETQWDSSSKKRELGR